MSYKDLLVIVDAGPDAGERLIVAAKLAERSNAHLTAVYPSVAPGMIGAFGFFDPAIMDPVYLRAQEQSGARAEEARTEFEGTVARQGISAEWRKVEGDPTELATRHGRYADLIVLGQVEPGNGQAELTHPRIEDVALLSGRPVLAVPYVGRFDRLGERVIVAWDGSREAARAVNDAMPLLAGASLVTVVSVDPERTPARHGGLPGADIALHLARHGVKAQVQCTLSNGIGIGETLLSRASDLEADLMVMGAFAHSRVRELLLGGATRTILESMTIPVLMAH